MDAVIDYMHNFVNSFNTNILEIGIFILDEISINFFTLLT